MMISILNNKPQNSCMKSVLSTRLALPSPLPYRAWLSPLNSVDPKAGRKSAVGFQDKAASD